MNGVYIMKHRIIEPAITYGQMNLLFQVRNLWRQLVTWTRAYLTNKQAGLNIAEETFNRLYETPREFGIILQMILGYETAQTFMQYLSVQLVLTKEIIDAYIAGNTDIINEKVQQLYQNADMRAELMASVVPYWNQTQIRNFLFTYHQYTLEQIVTLLSGDYARNIDIYDRLLHHADNMGDYFAEGLFNYIADNEANPAVPES